MTSGFNANVAARKPRTGIGRVISELASQTSEDAGSNGDAERAEASTVVASTEPMSAEPTSSKPRPTRARSLELTSESKESAATTRPKGGRDQVERLRERLAAAARPPLGEVEPQRTALAVRELVDGLRARLDMVVREKSELAHALEETRASLARAEADLRKEQRSRAAVQSQAEERQRIAADAVAEAEALAAERDQVLADLTEQRRLESEQSALLLEADAVLERHDAERSTLARELAEARELVELGKAEVADLEVRLETEAADRGRIEARCRELEGEVARLGQAREALESIEAISRGR